MKKFYDHFCSSQGDAGARGAPGPPGSAGAPGPSGITLIGVSTRLFAVIMIALYQLLAAFFAAVRLGDCGEYTNEKG